MRIAILQSGNNGFFPRFYKALYQSIIENGDECRLFSPNTGTNHRIVLKEQTIWGTRINWHIHNFLYRMTGLKDIWSVISTLDLIRKLSKFHPHVLHMHVVGEGILCMPLLIWYLNNTNIGVLWTMHDCRAFTGGCPYFDEIGCAEWLKGCQRCPLRKKGIPYNVGNTMMQYHLQLKIYTSIKKMYIVTPSQWLAEYVKRSFLKEKPYQVIHNGIDTCKFFKPSPFDVRGIYKIETKHIILGCAIVWESRKGIRYFEAMSSMLSKEFLIVLIGEMERDMSIRLKSKGILVIGKIDTPEELIAWYQQASVFVNPTLADNFPTTNIEALAAGTPVVTFRTGGSSEAINESSGIIVEKGDVNGLVDAIQTIVQHPEKYTKEECISQSSSFSVQQYNHYVELYHKMMNV